MSRGSLCMAFLLIMICWVFIAIYQDQSQIHAIKHKCLDKFNTLDYEIFNDVLYCKTSDGLVKFNEE